MRNLRRVFRYALLAIGIAAVVSQPVPAWAQTTATLQGTVKDESGGLMPGVQIKIHNEGTGSARTVGTDARGAYRAPELPVGVYSVEAQAPGFQTQKQTGIALSVGATAVVDLKMAVGAVTAVVEVAATPNIVETTSAALSNLVSTQQVENLPLNARSFEQLALLNPGVVMARTAGSNQRAGRATKISIGGSRPEGVSYLFDGADTNTATNINAGSVAGFQMGVEAIQEFRVLRHVFPAEYGRASGGVVNVVSKSGTNSFHGSLFEFLRNDHLDAKNFFDRPDPEPIPPFRRNQFGGSLGGPILRDRTFLFLTYEGLRERLGTTLVGPVPSLDTRRGFLRNAQGALEFVGVAPAVQPYINLYPLPNTGKDFGNGTAEWSSNPKRKAAENYALTKIDHRFSDSDAAFLSWTIDASDRTTPGNAVYGTFDISRRNFATISETHVFSPTLLNVFRFSFSRNDIFIDNFEFIPVSQDLFFTPNAVALGGLGAPGLIGINSDSRIPTTQVTNLFELDESISWTKGSHSLKFGGRIKRIQFNIFEDTERNGVWTFQSLREFLQNTPRLVQGRALTSDLPRGYRQFLNGFFAQDDWKVMPRVTLNLGVRYEFITNPSEVNGKNSILLDPRNGTINDFVVRDVIFNQNPSLRNFMPRVGLAWDVFGNGRTALRAGFGTFYDQVLPRIFTVISLNPPFFRSVLQQNPTSFPRIDFSQLLVQDPNSVRVRGIDANMQTPYTIQYNVDLQQQVSDTWRVSAGYSGTRGVKLFIRQNFNLRREQILPDGRRFWPVNAPFMNPNFSAIDLRTSQASSFYNALELSVEKRLSKGLRFQTAYTYSRSVDDGAGDVSTEGQNEPFQTPIFWDIQHHNRGLSAFDIRHALSFNHNYALPLAPGRSLQSQVFGGWELNGILTLQTGSPQTILIGFDRARNSLQGSRAPDRPSLRPGFRNNPVTGTTGGCLGVRAGQKLGRPDLYLDPCAFQLAEPGFLGNVGRNTIISPGLAVLDFSLQKRFVMPGEGKELLFRAEFYNLFNRPNFYIPGAGSREGGGADLIVFTDASQVPPPNFGRIFVTSTSSRQIQFALKYVF